MKKPLLVLPPCCRILAFWLVENFLGILAQIAQIVEPSFSTKSRIQFKNWNISWKIAQKDGKIHQKQRQTSTGKQPTYFSVFSWWISYFIDAKLWHNFMQFHRISKQNVAINNCPLLSEIFTKRWRRVVLLTNFSAGFCKENEEKLCSFCKVCTSKFRIAAMLQQRADGGLGRTNKVRYLVVD